MPLIQWIMNLQTSPVIIRPSRIVNYSIGEIVYDLSGQRWQIIDFNAYGSKETEYHVQYGDKRKRFKDSELITYIDLYSKNNCFNSLQTCVNNHHYGAVSYSPANNFFSYNIGDKTFDRHGNQWFVLNLKPSFGRENKYECINGGTTRTFAESELFSSNVRLSSVQNKVNKLNSLQTCLDDFKAKN